MAVGSALITGASVGIGREFARYHAQKGGDVVITARRAEALDALKSELESAHGITVHTIALDLGTPGAAKTLYDQVKALGVEVSVLINNAGFGGHGKFVERDLTADTAMIQLNVTALVELTHMVAKDMVARSSGKILHVGSTAGFMPGPLQATYFATKAFVNSFSQALDQELQGTGVTSTVLAPGYVHTEFAAAANLEGTDLVKQKGATPAAAAKHGYDAMMAKKLLTVNEAPLSFMVNWVMPLLPRRFALKTIQKMQAK